MNPTVNDERDDRLRDVTKAFINPRHIDRGYTNYTCIRCEEITAFKNKTLDAAFRNETEVQCRQCPRLPEGFSNALRRNHISCNACNLEYEHTKRTYYFKCYCQLRTKIDEHILYTRLYALDGATLSREQPVPGLGGHKVDIRLAFDDGITFWIEVDGRSHSNTPQKEADLEFETQFRRICRGSNNFLIRIRTSQILKVDKLETFVAKLCHNDYLQRRVTLSSELDL